MFDHEATRRQPGDQAPGNLVIVFNQKNTNGCLLEFQPLFITDKLKWT